MKSKATKAQEAAVRNQEKAIKQIIKRYGKSIDLRKSPYLIAEIIREYAHVFVGPGDLQGGESGPIPGSHGTPPPPPPGSDSMFNPYKKYMELSQKITRLAQRVKQLEKTN